MGRHAGRKAEKAELLQGRLIFSSPTPRHRARSATLPSFGLLSSGLSSSPLVSLLSLSPLPLSSAPWSPAGHCYFRLSTSVSESHSTLAALARRSADSYGASRHRNRVLARRSGIGIGVSVSQSQRPNHAERQDKTRREKHISSDFTLRGYYSSTTATATTTTIDTFHRLPYGLAPTDIEEVTTNFRHHTGSVFVSFVSTERPQHRGH